MNLAVRHAQRIINLMKIGGQFDIPVSLGSILTLTNIHIYEYPFKSLEAFLFQFEEQKYLIYNPNRRDSRQRFTIAHEIGHAVLGHPVSSININGFALPGKYESQADRFAEEVLMPRDEFCRLYRNHFSGLPLWQRPELIADHFAVSRQAADLRVRRLKLNLKEVLK